MSPSPDSPVSTVTTQPSIYSPQPVYHPNVRSPSLHSQALSDFESGSKTSSLLGPPLTRDPSSVASNTTGYLPTPTDDVMHVPPPLSRDETTLTAYYRNQAFPERFVQPGLTRKSRGIQGPHGSQTHQRPVSVRTRTNSHALDCAALEINSVPVRDITSSSERRNVAQDSAPIMPPRMERQRAARDLISRYEDLDSASQAPPITRSNSQTSSPQRLRSVSNVAQMSRRDLSLPPVPPISTSPTRNQGAVTDPPRAPHSHCLPESPSYFSSFARKGGKLRNSFTNLVQLLGDKAKSKDHAKKRNSVSPSMSPSRTINALPKGFKLKLSKRASADSSPSGSPGKAKGPERPSIFLPDMNELLKSEPMVSTLLLYQSPARQTNPSILDQKMPLWMPYSVSLYPTTIILQVPNPGLSSSSKFQIPLSELYDAHSIAAKDLPPGSIPPPGATSLPSDFGSDIYVFEAQCYGGRIERFAAPSMAVRTTWVRHLLDVLADQSSDSKNWGKPVKVGESTVSTPSATPIRSPIGVATKCLTNPGSLAGDTTTTTKPIEPVFDSKLSVEERPPSALMRLSTPTKPLGRALGSRSGSVCGARQVASVFPNPWDPPTTPSRRPTSAMTQRTSSLLMSPRSDRSGMTASPSICRLDERNLVRNRLAMFEQQTSPSPSRRDSVRNRGAREGSVNWEALSEVRSGRSGSVLSRTTSGVRSPGIRSFSGTLEMVGGAPSPVKTHSNNGTLFRPMWPFPEPAVPSNATVPSDASAKPDGSTLEHGFSSIGLATLCSVDGPNAVLGRGPQEAGAPLVSLSTNRITKLEPKPIQVLGNLPPSNKAEIAQPQPTLRPVEMSAQDPSLQLILDRLGALVSALRESDVAHSTKASGLGQLIASTQDRIVQAVEGGTGVSTAEHVELVGRVEGLREIFESLVVRPSFGTEERADLSSIKETIERIDRVIPTKLDDLFGDREEDREKMKTIIAGQTDGLKQTIQDLALKLDWASTQNDVLVKLDTLIETVAGVSSTRDLDLMTEFVQQVKSHISSPPATSLDPLITDTSTIMEKLDSISSSMVNSAVPIDLSAIQATLEHIRELSEARQTSDAAPASTTPHPDMSDVVMKLDGITAMCQSIIETGTGASDPAANSGGPQGEAQQTLLTALKEDAEQRSAQAQQTAELVRYSNELNSWLEKFVTNASKQMDDVGAGLGVLRRDLGLDPPPPTNGQEDAGPLPQGVIQELRMMFEEQIKSAGDIAASLSALLVAFNEEKSRNVQVRENLATDPVLRMIEVQRQEQERLLKQLASDLSSDIRGERIRFVEAMSQATSMNVQLHVEEFKKQLTHEVLALTDEVGRLREERKTIQHQIAQLFLVKSEHEAECRPSDAPQPPPRPSSSTRPNGR